MSVTARLRPAPYRFTEQEHAAAERDGFVKQINSFSMPRGQQSEFGNYDFRDGIYGEMAFAYWSGLDRVVPEQGQLTDGGWDFVDPESDEGPVAIDVKATAARGTWSVGRAHLLRPASYSLRAHVYVLIVLDADRRRARFAGWATNAELQAAPLRRKGDEGRPRVYVPTRCIPESQLHHDWRGWA